MSATLAAEARSHSARAAAFTRKAEREARTAAEFYELAAQWTARGRVLTATWSPRFDRSETAASAEDLARNMRRNADAMLRYSFHCTRSAAHYRELAASYRRMAKAQAARLAV